MKHTYTQVQQMRKTGGWLDGVADIASGFGDISTRAVVAFLASGAAFGYGLGWGAAKLMSHGERDMDTIRKGYENERLKTDIGYVGSQLKAEIEQAKENEPPKAARIMEV